MSAWQLKSLNPIVLADFDNHNLQQFPLRNLMFKAISRNNFDKLKKLKSK